MARNIDAITTASVLTQDEISLVRRGCGHLVDNGYGKIDDVLGLLRCIAVQIERDRRELDYVTRHLFSSMVEEAEVRIKCKEAGFRNLVWRSGVALLDGDV